MRVKAELRAQFGEITSRANELLRVMQGLPATAEAMQAAAKVLTGEERAQIIWYLQRLSASLYAIREHSLWVKWSLEQGQASAEAGASKNNS